MFSLKPCCHNQKFLVIRFAFVIVRNFDNSTDVYNLMWLTLVWHVIFGKFHRKHLYATTSIQLHGVYCWTTIKDSKRTVNCSSYTGTWKRHCSPTHRYTQIAHNSAPALSLVSPTLADVPPPPPVILEKTIRIPRSLSVKACGILKGFLNKNPGERLGCHPESGFQDIVNHPFFKSIDWEMVRVCVCARGGTIFMGWNGKLCQFKVQLS